MRPVESTPREKTMAANAVKAIADLTAQNDQLANELIVLYQRERKLLNGIRKRDQKVETLQQKLVERDRKLAELDRLLTKQKGEVGSANDRLERLRKTKVMKLQRQYWKLRRSLRGGSGGGAQV